MSVKRIVFSNRKLKSGNGRHWFEKCKKNELKMQYHDFKYPILKHYELNPLILENITLGGDRVYIYKNIYQMFIGYLNKMREYSRFEFYTKDMQLHIKLKKNKNDEVQHYIVRGIPNRILNNPIKLDNFKKLVKCREVTEQKLKTYTKSLYNCFTNTHLYEYSWESDEFYL